MEENIQVENHEEKQEKDQRSGCGCSIWTILFGVLGLFLVIALLLPNIECAREAARRSACTNQLKQIELAMRGYHEEYGRFPPAYTVDENGRPLHSWRTLILPFCEQRQLYKKIKLDEPWDSPDNLAVYGNLPVDVYLCPSTPDTDEEEGLVRTNYVMVTGPRCVSDGPNSRSLDELPDGASNTIHVVETVEPIRWYEPRDLKAEEINFTVNVELSSKSLAGISSWHPGVALGAFCDGSVQPLSAGTDPEELRAMFEVDNSKEGKASWKKAFGEMHEQGKE